MKTKLFYFSMGIVLGLLSPPVVRALITIFQYMIVGMQATGGDPNYPFGDLTEDQNYQDAWKNIDRLLDSGTTTFLEYLDYLVKEIGEEHESSDNS